MSDDHAPVPPSSQSLPPPPPPPPSSSGFPSTPTRFCGSCGNPVAANTVQCAFCGAIIAKVTFPGQKSRLVAGLLGIFVGGFGVHSFYLGDNKKGVWQIVATLLTCGIASLWGLVEGIMILAGKVNTDFDGRPLAD